MITIKKGGLDEPSVVELMQLHLHHARAETAPGSAHALDLDVLRGPDIRFWSAWDGGALAGFGALKLLTSDHGEVKSMHTAQSARRSGVGSMLLERIIETARKEGLSRVSLETGTWPYFEPAREFYLRHGFEICPPFGNYVLDENSLFMTRAV